MAGPVDPDRIDISLDLVGEGSLAAVEQLSEQLSRVAEYMSQFGGDTDAAARVQSRMGQRYRTGTGVNEGGPSQGASIAGGAIPPQDAHGQGGSYAGVRTPRQFIDRVVQRYGERERGQHARRALNGMPDYDLSGVGTTSGGGYGYDFGNDYMNTYVDGGSRPGRPSASASMPFNPNQPAWRNALQASPAAWEQMQEGFRLPPGGLSMNLQDKLRLASNFFGNAAERAYSRQYQPEFENQLTSLQARNLPLTDETLAAIAHSQTVDAIGTGASGDFRGRMSVLLREASASNALVGLQAVGRDIRGFGQRTMAYGGGLQQAGVEAGFARAGQVNIPGTNIGITNPLDLFRSNSAFREGINQRVNVQRLRMMGGINREQANAIVGSLAGAGWTGEEGQDLAFNAIAPLVQQGLNPEITTAMMDQAIRNGNTPVRDFVDALKDLGPAARSARMSLTEYQEALGDFATWAKDNGATYGQGLNLGRNVSQSLGMAPQVAQSLLQSPFVQAGTISQGLLPNEMGLMNGSMAQDSIFQMLSMAEGATSNFPAIRDAQGNVVVSGRDRQDAQIASIMGTTAEVVKSLRRQRESSPAASRALDQIGRYSSTAKAVGQHPAFQQKRVQVGDYLQVPASVGQAAQQRGEDVQKVGNDYYMKATADNFQQTGVMIGGQGRVYDPKGIATASAISELQHGRGSSWDAVAKNLRSFEASAIHTDANRSWFDKRMQEIGGIDDPQKRATAARKLVNDTMQKVRGPQQDNRPTVYVDFTGAAKKFFKQTGQDGKDIAKDAAARGSAPITDYATGYSAPRLSGSDFLNP